MTPTTAPRPLALVDIVNSQHDPAGLLAAIQLHQAGRFAEAAIQYHAMLVDDVATGRAENPALYYLLGLLSHQTNDHAEAASLLGQAHALAPTWVEALYNLAVVRMHLGEYRRAERLLHQAADLDPGAVPVWNNLGNCALARGDANDAIRCFNRALELPAAGPEIRWNRSHVRALLGDWLNSWDDFENRWVIAGFRAHNSYPDHLPRLLDLEQLRPGARVFVSHEQGAGDQVMMWRYLPAMLDRGARVYCRVSDSLVELLRRAMPAPHLMVVSAGEANPAERLSMAAGYVIPCMSLPRLFKTTPATVPLADGYLWPGHRPTTTGGLVRVGVCWKGSPDHRNDKNRSIPLTLVPLLARVITSALTTAGAEVELVSLVPTVELPEGVAPGLAPGVTWADSADRVRSLDLVVTVDTGIAHLAGAMGVPVKLLLATPCDWRWGLRGSSTPWYHSIHLLRQYKAGDWLDCFSALASTLETGDSLTNKAES